MIPSYTSELRKTSGVSSNPSAAGHAASVRTQTGQRKVSDNQGNSKGSEKQLEKTGATGGVVEGDSTRALPPHVL